MTNSTDKHVLLGITGGIAAYKAAELVRQLRRDGAQVRVIMTAAAQSFVTPLTFQALSGQPVHTELLDAGAEAGMGHIELARWAHLLLVAPASADFMARLAHGLADDLLTTCCLAADCPVVVAPAMNQAMWRNRATRANAAILEERGIELWGPGDGAQACGDMGPGRMLDPSVLAEAVKGCFVEKQLAGRKVVITAGPTREAIDPVRYLSNHSSGKMGFALAQAAAQAGARVILVSGPVALPTPPGVQRVDVVSAEQMLHESRAAVDGADVFVGAAAVSDYRPRTPAAKKTKKSSGTVTLELELNADVVATVARENPRLFTVGFAAETHNLLEFARRKRQAKGLQLIIANEVGGREVGFDSDDNAVTLISADGERVFDRRSKLQLARELVEEFAARLAQREL